MELDDSVSPVEVAVVGLSDREAILGWVDGALRQLLGLSLDRVEFVAGRIDAVYGVTTVDGQRLPVKVHRPLSSRLMPTGTPGNCASTGRGSPLRSTGT